MWFVDNKVIDGLELRQWMGDVEETIVAKHASRMGLVGALFSTGLIAAFQYLAHC